MTDLFQELQPKQLDLISVKSNASQFYTSTRDSKLFERKKKSQVQNISAQIEYNSQKENQIKNEAIQENNYFMNKKNFRKDICAKRDYVPVNQTQTKLDQKSWKTMNSVQMTDTSEKKQIQIDKLNELQEKEKIRIKQYQSKFQKYFQDMYQKGSLITNKNIQNSKTIINKSKNQEEIIKEDAKQDYKNDQQKQKEAFKENLKQKLNEKLQKLQNLTQDQQIQQGITDLQQIQSQIKLVQDKNDQPEKQENICSPQLDFQITSKQIQFLLQNYPQLDLKNLDNQNLDYIAHLIGVCQCFTCECNTCKCPYAINNWKYKYNFYDLQTSNGVNHNLNVQKKFNTDLDCRFPYETDPYKEQIIKNSTYKKDFDEKKQPEQFQTFKHKKYQIPFVNLTTYQANYAFWKKEQPDILRNLQQINIQKKFNPYIYQSLYQDSYQQKEQKPEYQPPRKYQPEQLQYEYSLKPQPFQYQSQYMINYKGQYSKKSRPYSQYHRIYQENQIPQHFTSINQKMNKDLQLGTDKLCPQKQFNKEALKQQILQYFQN